MSRRPLSRRPSVMPPCPLPLCHEEVRIATDDTNIDAVLAYPDDGQPHDAAVIVGPHPFLGGDMTNNVVVALGDGLAHAGFATVRFDYAGTLAKTAAGAFDVPSLDAFWTHSSTDDEAERWRDLEAVIGFVRSSLPTTRIHLVAYSFGSHVVSTWLTRAHHATWAEAIVCISPTIDKHDLSGLAASDIDKLVIVSADDFATDHRLLQDVVAPWRSTTVTLAGDRDGHFFRGHEPWLVQQALDFFGIDRRDTDA